MLHFTNLVYHRHFGNNITYMLEVYTGLIVHFGTKYNILSFNAMKINIRVLNLMLIKTLM